MDNKNFIIAVPFKDVAEWQPDSKCYKIKKEGLEYFCGVEDGSEFDICFCWSRSNFVKVSGHYPLNINDIPYNEIWIRNVDPNKLVRIQKSVSKASSNNPISFPDKYYFIWDVKFSQTYVPENKSLDFIQDRRNMTKLIKWKEGLNIFKIGTGTIGWIGLIEGKKENGDAIIWCP